jgi:phage baseplate assembly protein W
MHPDFGSIIWDMLFEPMTSDNLQLIIDDCYQIVAADGRVQIRDIKLTEYDNGLQLQIDLYYQPLDIVEVFSIEFDRRSVENTLL